MSKNTNDSRPLAREDKILMRLPDGKKRSNPPSRSRERTIDTKLLIYGLFQKGRVLAQDGEGYGLRGT